MALSPMARQVADVGVRQQAVQEAQQEAAACREHLHSLHQQHASSLNCTDAQRQECTRVSFPESMQTLRVVHDSQWQCVE